MANSNIRTWDRSLRLTRNGDLMELDGRLPLGMLQVTIRELGVDGWVDTSIILEKEQVDAIAQWIKDRK